jgi:hypothetical protein
MLELADCGAWQGSWLGPQFWHAACMGPVSGFEFRGHCEEAVGATFQGSSYSLIFTLPFILLLSLILHSSFDPPVLPF